MLHPATQVLEVLLYFLAVDITLDNTFSVFVKNICRCELCLVIKLVEEVQNVWQVNYYWQRKLLIPQHRLVRAYCADVTDYSGAFLVKYVFEKTLSYVLEVHLSPHLCRQA